MNQSDRRLHRQLRALPLRRAPQALTASILAAAAAEAARPWWRKAWWAWPAPARWSFMIVVGAAGGLALSMGLEAVSSALSGLSAARALFEAGCDLMKAAWMIGGLPLQSVAAMMFVFCCALATGLGRLTATRERRRPAPHQEISWGAWAATVKPRHIQ